MTGTFHSNALFCEFDQFVSQKEKENTLSTKGINWLANVSKKHKYVGEWTTTMQWEITLNKCSCVTLSIPCHLGRLPMTGFTAVPFQAVEGIVVELLLESLLSWAGLSPLGSADAWTSSLVSKSPVDVAVRLVVREGCGMPFVPLSMRSWGTSLPAICRAHHMAVRAFLVCSVNSPMLEANASTSAKKSNSHEAFPKDLVWFREITGWSFLARTRLPDEDSVWTPALKTFC